MSPNSQLPSPLFFSRQSWKEGGGGACCSGKQQTGGHNNDKKGKGGSSGNKQWRRGHNSGQEGGRPSWREATWRIGHCGTEATSAASGGEEAMIVVSNRRKHRWQVADGKLSHLWAMEGWLLHLQALDGCLSGGKQQRGACSGWEEDAEMVHDRGDHAVATGSKEGDWGIYFIIFFQIRWELGNLLLYRAKAWWPCAGMSLGMIFYDWLGFSW